MRRRQNSTRRRSARAPSSVCRRCVIIGCGLTSRTAPRSVSFHALPRSTLAWVRTHCAAYLPADVDLLRMHICSRHYHASFVNVSAAPRSRRMLCTNAIPTIFTSPAELTGREQHNAAAAAASPSPQSPTEDLGIGSRLGSDVDDPDSADCDRSSHTAGDGSAAPAAAAAADDNELCQDEEVDDEVDPDTVMPVPPVVAVPTSPIVSDDADSSSEGDEDLLEEEQVEVEVTNVSESDTFEPSDGCLRHERGNNRRQQPQQQQLQTQQQPQQQQQQHQTQQQQQLQEKQLLSFSYDTRHKQQMDQNWEQVEQQQEMNAPCTELDNSVLLHSPSPHSLDARYFVRRSDKEKSLLPTASSLPSLSFWARISAQCDRIVGLSAELGDAVPTRLKEAIEELERAMSSKKSSFQSGTPSYCTDARTDEETVPTTTLATTAIEPQIGVTICGNRFSATGRVSPPEDLYVEQRVAPDVCGSVVVVVDELDEPAHAQQRIVESFEPHIESSGMRYPHIHTFR